MTDTLPLATAGAPARRSTLQGIQAARGIAASLVVAYHGGRMLALPQYVGYVPLHGIFAFGHAGVDFFFVLSGFIISYVHHADVGRPQRLMHYILQRTTRIYPVYWVVTALLIASLCFSHVPLARLGPLHIIASLLLIPHNQDPVLGVAWTLEHEMLFYVAFGLAILSRRLGQFLLLGCMLLATLAIANPPSNWIARFLSSLYHLEFLLGIAAAMVVRRWCLPAPRGLACIGICAFLATGVAEDAGLIITSGPVSLLLFGTSSALTISGLAAAERLGVLAIGRIGIFLGAASYAIYLVHVPAIADSAWIAAWLGVIKLAPGWAVLLVAFTVAITAACVLHLYVERPLISAVRRRLLRPATLAHPKHRVAVQLNRELRTCRDVTEGGDITAPIVIPAKAEIQVSAGPPLSPG
jgi:exopolysaccharide production protein ExoZ